MIPTREKKRLPKGFSYPLGAKKISDCLGDVPQIEAMRLTFEWRDEFWVSKWRKRINEHGIVTLMEVQYASRSDEWWLFVYSVPSEYNVAARDLLLGGAIHKLSTLLRDAGRSPEYFAHTIQFNLGEQSAT